MQPLISVIVPIYNVEDCLPLCLDSLCRQSLKNIEILLVDDASPDRCSEICEQYAMHDPRIKVFHHKKNKGLSAARNTGIQHAISDYLMFVDSDDWVHEDFCKDAYECAINNNADLVMFGYQHIQNNTLLDKQAQYLTHTVPDGFRNHEDAINLTFTAFGMVAWNKLYQRKLFENILYPDGQVFEDSATSYKLVWKAANVYCMNKVLYYRYLRPGSITMRKPTREMVRERFKVYWRQCCDLSEWGFHSVQQDQFKVYAALTYCIQTPLDFTDSYYSIAANVLQNVIIVPSGFTRRRKFLIKLFKISPNLFNFVCTLCNKQVH